MKINHTNIIRYIAAAFVTAVTTMTVFAESPVKVYIMAGQSNMQGKGAAPPQSRPDRRADKNSLKKQIPISSQGRGQRAVVYRNQSSRSTPR
jgi:hypothetical protein